MNSRVNPVRILNVMLLLFTQPVLAEEARVVLDDTLPSLEFLDYLGGMVETGDELTGPVSLDEASGEGDAGGRDQWISGEDDQQRKAGVGYRD